LPDFFSIDEKHVNLLSALRPFIPEDAGDFIEMFVGYTRMARNNRLDPESVKAFADTMNKVQERQALRIARAREAAVAATEKRPNR